MTSYSLSLVYVAAVTCILYSVWTAMAAILDWRRRICHMKIIPTSRHHWLFGHLYYFPGPGQAGVDYLRNMIPETPYIGVCWYGFLHHSVGIGHPSTLKTVLKSSAPKARRFGGYVAIQPWLGDGLLLSSGKKWARNRRLLTPAFHFDILKPYIAIKNKATEILMENMMQYYQKGEYFEVFGLVSLCTLDIILRCAFSYDNDFQIRGEDHPYVKTVQQIGDAAFERSIKPWLYPDFIYYLTPQGRRFRKNCNYVHSVSRNIIENRKKALEMSPGQSQVTRKYLDFLDILLTAKDEDGIGLSDQEIQDEADTFLFEGHDTTSSGISWTLYDLAVHPDHQRQCQAEIDAMLQGRPDHNIRWEDLSQLSYLTMCIKESMRLHSPVPIIQREMIEDSKIGDYHIPKGTVLDLHIYGLHHNPKVWENSLEYIPDRFSPDNIANMDPYSFMPFSAGPRNCIGQNFAMHEQKVVIARILKQFNIEVHPSREVRHLMSLVMRTEDGIYLKVTPRSQVTS